MGRLALASLRSRLTASTACALSVFLGMTILLAFGSLLETGLADGVPAGDAEALVTMASVVGGWGLVIVLFSVASTLGISVRRRGAELAALRAIGATNRQIRTLVRRETAVVALVSAIAGVLPGWAAGAWLMTLFRRGGLVVDTVEHRVGVVTVAALVTLLVLVSTAAASIAARHATAGSPRASIGATAVETERLRPIRVVGAVLLVWSGLVMGTLSIALGTGSDDPFLAMQFAGPASVYAAMGLALLGPVWLRLVARVAGPALSRLGAAGHLAVEHARNRSVRLGSALLPVIVFVGVATGTLYLMAIHQDTMTQAAIDADPEGVVELLNYVVVGMLSVFAAIMVVNTLVSATVDRRRELGRQRMLGATDADVVATLTVEGVLLLVTGVLVGGLASLVTIVPFAVAKTGSPVPAGGPWLFLAVVAVAAAATVGTSAAAVSRLVRRPALASAVTA